MSGFCGPVMPLGKESRRKVYILHQLMMSIVSRPIGGVSRFFFSSRRRHTRYWRDWSSDVCSSDLLEGDAKHLLGPFAHLDERVDECDVGIRVGDKVRQLRDRDAAVGGPLEQQVHVQRSEERRVGKECRSRWSPYH